MYACAMAEITTKRQGEIIRTLFGLLKEEPEGIRAKDAIAQLVENFQKINEEGRQLLPIKAVHYLDPDAIGA